ncbi:hypothetical protein KY285_007538 [Solanum tuberosum]|nr:hypothetical protein KY285_007538 [Solanum tuberosum]
MASSSSSASNSQYCTRWKYNVFLSFRGKDTRRNFTSHLYEGLDNRGIENGDSIPQELLKAIEESQVALIIFSKNYATSRWCLNELVKIMECKEKENGETVIPIFYDVDPSHVRNQNESFAVAFAEHELKYKDDVEGMQKVQGWRNALSAAADLKGYDIRDGIESENIHKIVDHISSKLCKTSYYLSSLQDVVGINAHLEKLKSLLQIEINDVRIVGIWGIGGVGDVGWFGNGSRVVVTTRNKHLIEKDDAIYEVSTLPDHEAMQLFNQHAFRKEIPNERFMKFSLEGTNAMEAIWIYGVQKLCFSEKVMKKLRLLSIISFHTHDDSIEYLPNNLRWFVCHDYPWESLLENFEPKKLVYLDLQHSLLLQLWTGTKHLPSLRKLNLNHSKRLLRTPDFTGMPNLEYLNLCNCSNLEEVHRSLGCSRKLIWLKLYNCECLKRFPCVNVESLRSLDLRYCSSLEKFPGILGRMKPELEIKMRRSGVREIPSSFIQQHACRLTELDLSFMKNLVSLPSNICQLKGLVKLIVSCCSKLESLPEEIGDLENLVTLNAECTLISRAPSSITWLNKLKYLSFAYQESKFGVSFVFPEVNEGLRSLESLNLSDCNLLDGGLPEDIGCLSSLKTMYLNRNKFEHLPRSIAQLGALQSLYLSNCTGLEELPSFTGMSNLETLNLSNCNIIDGRLPEDIGCLSSLKELNLSGNSFEYLPRSIAQLGALRSLDLSDSKRLTQLPEFPQQLDTIGADWTNDSICNSLFQNISSLQHDISASDSLPLRVFTTRGNIPRWFHHRENGRSISVKLPENWYISDNFLGFAVCYSGKLINAEAHLICYDGRPVTCITQKLSLSNHSKCPAESAIHFFLVPLAGLWDTSKANGKTPNDYGRVKLFPSGEMKEFGLRLLYKDEPKIEVSFSSSKKQ